MNTLREQIKEVSNKKEKEQVTVKKTTKKTVSKGQKEKKPKKKVAEPVEDVYEDEESSASASSKFADFAQNTLAFTIQKKEMILFAGAVALIHYFGDNLSV